MHRHRALNLHFHVRDERPVLIFVARAALEGNPEHPCSLIGSAAYLASEVSELARHRVVLGPFFF
eukprot:CAMPEP_0194291316 /NCGR_PEP_ID=MMETSP0169-20130528/43178_1 /TAXON_ID=218684 /ORGANISM="Corethron pennatum, Strain L29A3" /LENGTH=64 /DNA_ID=CAMNT_0039039157 /DNA_START=364 /DNA_END=555 /DNA_ORIENTATION=+